MAVAAAGAATAADEAAIGVGVAAPGMTPEGVAGVMALCVGV